MLDSLAMCLFVFINCTERNQIFQKQFHTYRLDGVDSLKSLVEYFFRLLDIIECIENAENSHDIITRDCDTYSSNKLLLFCLALLFGLLLQDAMQSKRIWQHLSEEMRNCKNSNQFVITKGILTDYIIKVLREFVAIKLNHNNSEVTCLIQDKKLLSMIGQISRLAEIRDRELLAHKEK